MDPFVALLLLPPVIAGSVLAHAAVKRRWAVHEIITRMTAAEREVIESRSALRERYQRIEQAHIRADEAHDRLNDLERHVASLKSQLSLSSTARR